MLRYVRIVVSVLSVAGCVLLIALWVRTHYSSDTIFGPLPGRLGFVMTSRQGGLGVGLLRQGISRWGTSSFPPDNVPPLPYKSFLGIGACSTSSLLAVRTPYWFQILVTGSIAFAAWTKEPWRFGLRTLLLAMTLVAAVLGAVVYVVR